VIEIPAESFTYGGALNTGTEAARAPIIVALSAHAYPHNPRWLELMAAAIDRDGVACATPWSFGPDGRPMTEPILLDVELAREWGPLAGYFAKRESVPLDIAPVTPARDGPLSYVFDIAMGVRRGDSARAATLDAELAKRRPEIERILAEYGVPLLSR